MVDQNKITPELARSMLWSQGVLKWLLKPVQHRLYDSVEKCDDKIVVWNCSRRLGKSTTLCILAIETCLKTPGAIVKYCCAKQKDAKGIIRPLIRELLETCPPELKPEFKTQESYWIFPNGSTIELSGLDGGRAESIRGIRSHLCIIDEAGLVDDLPYIVTSILLPTTSTTQAKIILASTPPRSPSHPFITKYLRSAEAKNNLVTITVEENPNIPPDELQKIIEEYGGVDSIEYQREFMCQIIKDDNYAIIPEFNADLKKRIVKPWDRAAFYDGYVAMDLGLKDLTVVLFAWYDFLNAKLIIEDEFVINGQKFNTIALAEGINKKEKEVFTDPMTGETRIPYLRVSDNNLMVIKDLWDLHRIRFIPTQKQDAEAALNKVRVMLGDEQIIINPKCKTLITHLEHGVWNKQKTSFARNEADNGHWDAIDSLKYLVRNLQVTKNPYPSWYNKKSTTNEFTYRKPENQSHVDWGKVFNMGDKSKTYQPDITTQNNIWKIKK